MSQTLRSLAQLQAQYGKPSPRRANETATDTLVPASASSDTLAETLAGRLPGAWATLKPARRRADRVFEDLDDWEDLDAGAAQRERTDRIEGFVDRIFKHAGTTPGPLSGIEVPLLAFSPCHLPQPSDDIPAREVLDRLVVRIEPFVAAGPYVAILFAAPTPEAISMPALLSLYNSLPKSARKNLERLYIVRAPFWTRLSVTVPRSSDASSIIRAFLATIVSAKVSSKRKLSVVSSLSELGRALDIAAVEIPQAVATLNATNEASIGEPDAATRQFGVALEHLMGEKGERGLPRVVRDCVRVLGATDASLTQGLFRISASKSTVGLLQQLYDRGHPVTLEDWTDAHVAASLLKTFLGSLPSPIFPSELYPAIEGCPSIDADVYIRDRVLAALSIPELELLKCVALVA